MRLRLFTFTPIDYATCIAMIRTHSREEKADRKKSYSRETMWRDLDERMATQHCGVLEVILKQLYGEIGVRFVNVIILVIFWTFMLTNWEFRVESQAINFSTITEGMLKKVSEDYGVSLAWAELNSHHYKDRFILVTKHRGREIIIKKKVYSLLNTVYVVCGSIVIFL